MATGHIWFYRRRRIPPAKRESQKVKDLFRYLAGSCLFLIHRQLQFPHDCPHPWKASSALPCLHRSTRSSAYVTMQRPKRRSSPSFFHVSTNRRMYKSDSSGEMGDPCGIPRPLSLASVVRFFRPRSSVSSTALSSYILIRCSTRRSTMRHASDCISSACGMLPK